MFGFPGHTSDVTDKHTTITNGGDHKSIPPQKSQRYLDLDGDETDLKVPKTMQDFVYKKMSKTIENSIEFVQLPDEKPKKRKETFKVKLLNDTDPIQHYESNFSEFTPIKQVKPEIKMRVIEHDQVSETDKFRMAAVDGNEIILQKETKDWKQKKIKPDKFYRYKEKNNLLYLIEAENEFTKLRKKNNWSESKIAGFRQKKKK